MVYNNFDLKYILEKKGYSLSDVALKLDVTPQTIFHVIWDMATSQRFVRNLEKLLDITSGSLEISREKRNAIIKVA